MANRLHQTSAGNDASPFASSRRNPDLPLTSLQQQFAPFVQRVTGTNHTPRKRGRPRKANASGQDNSTPKKKKRRSLGNDIRQLIVQHREDGKSIKQIATLVKRPQSTVASFLKRWEKTGRVEQTTKRNKATKPTKYTQEMKLVACCLSLLEPTITLKTASHLMSLSFPTVGFSESSIHKFFMETNMTLKDVCTRKQQWNTPSTLRARSVYPDFVKLASTRFRILYMDEQNFNVHMRRRKGRAPIGHKPMKQLPERTAKGGAISLHLAVTARYGAVHAMVVNKDADQVSTRQFLEGLVDALHRLDGQILAQGADVLPWLLILDNDKQHHTKHVVEYLEQAGLSYAFLPPYSPFLNPIEYVFSDVKQELGKLPEFNRTFFQGNRTASQLLRLTKRVLFAVQATFAKDLDKVSAFEKRCTLFHSACEHKMPIYDGSRPPSVDDVDTWRTNQAEFEAKFEDEDQDSTAMADSYRMFMDIPIARDGSPLDQAAEILERWGDTVEAEADKLLVTTYEHIGVGTPAWCRRAPLPLLEKYVLRTNHKATSLCMQTLLARMKAKIAMQQAALKSVYVDTRSTETRRREVLRAQASRGILASTAMLGSPELRRSQSALGTLVRSTSVDTEETRNAILDKLQDAKLLLDAGSGSGTDPGAAAAAPPLPPAAVTAAEDGECKGVEGRPMRAVEAEVAAAVGRPPTAPPLDAGEAQQRRRAARLAQAKAERKEDRERYWMWVQDTITLEGTGGRADREVPVWRAKSATLFCDPAGTISRFTPLNYGAAKQDRHRELVDQILAEARASGMVDGRSGKRELLHYRAVAMSFDQFSAAAIEASALVPYVDPRDVANYLPQAV